MYNHSVDIDMYTIPRMIIYYAICNLGMKTGSGKFAWENAILGLLKLVFFLFFIVTLICKPYLTTDLTTPSPQPI